MKKYISDIFLLILSALGVCSCFKNDMSYPIVACNIVKIAVEGQASEPVINSSLREVKITLDEVTDIRNVKVTAFEVTEGARVLEGKPSVLDLSEEVNFTLQMYLDKYDWKITAEQPIERYVEVENQIGESVIDVKDNVAYVYVARSQDLHEIVFTAMKLEPEGSEVVYTSYALEEKTACDFPTDPIDSFADRFFYVRPAGDTGDDNLVKWRIDVRYKPVTEEVASVNAWCTHATVHATFTGVGDPVIMYKRNKDSRWDSKKAIAPEISDVYNLTAELTGLKASTKYDVKVVCGEIESPVFNFTTETPEQLANTSFDDGYWNGDPKNRGVWYPYLKEYSDKDKIWDTANKGCAKFINSITTETDDAVRGKAVKMVGKDASIAFSGGNLYIGKFGDIDGIGAKLDWGIPFTNRPVALKGWYKYSPETINKVAKQYESEYGHLKDVAMDKCQIQIFLTDWTEPFHVNTNKVDGRVNFDTRDDGHIIARTNFVSDEEVSEWTQFYIPINYYDTERKPTYIVITCCTSYLADYFVGGEESTLYIDEFELVYEGDPVSADEVMVTVGDKQIPIATN